MILIKFDSGWIVESISKIYCKISIKILNTMNRESQSNRESAFEKNPEIIYELHSLDI